MERLTTNKDVTEMGMVELAHNSCYVKDGRARYRDFELDMDARNLTRELFMKYVNGDYAFEEDESFDELMVDHLQDGLDNIDGMLALFYRNLWAMADLWGRLKHYEDLEEHGLLVKLPCKIRGTVYWLNNHYGVGGNYKVTEETAVCFDFDEELMVFMGGPKNGVYGKTVFGTREEAEQALKEMGDK